MGAGDSARSVVERADASAAAHRRRAERAERMAAQFREGALGEEALHAVLARLVARGWSPMPDRRSPTGGNMDELLVGPAGVAVLDAKAWSHPVRLRGGRFYSGQRCCTDHLDHVLGQVEEVRAALARSALSSVAVRGFIALTGGVDRSRPPEEMRGVWVVGLDHLAAGFHRLPEVNSRDTTAAVQSVLDVAFPEFGREPSSVPPTVVSPRPFERNVRIFYVRNWKSMRLYLKSPGGADLGWKDLGAGAVHVECSGDDAELVEAVLRDASRSGIGISAEDLPRLALDLPAGKLLGLMGHVWVSVLLGWESGRRPHRLYGTYLVPGAGTFPLGFVDLSTGALFPSIHGKLGPDFQCAEEYLRLLWERWPGHRRQRG